MSSNQTDERHRVVRIPLAIDLIRAMDQAILSGRGGFSTRHEFIDDAIRERLVELNYEAAPPLPTEGHELATHAGSSSLRQVARSEQPGWAQTALHASRIATDALQPGQFEIADEPLSGFHNRDYPSLFALYCLALQGALALDEALNSVVARAREHGALLLEIEKATGSRISTLFPTNAAKPQSAEARFRNFAIGEFDLKAGVHKLWGPLFTWRLATISQVEGGLHLGTTPNGLDLLRALDGIEAREPHCQDHARRFLDHLREFAPNDWTLLRDVVARVAQGDARRVDVVHEVTSAWTHWSENEASNAATSYIARAREWGLVQPKQRDRLYVPTEFGIEYTVDTQAQST